MLNFEKWFYTNEKIIEEGIEIDPSTKTLYINKESDSENSIVDFFPSQYFYNTNIKDPRRDGNVVDSLFGCYIVNDNEKIDGSDGNSIKSGNGITGLLYHTFKVGKFKKGETHPKVLLDPNYMVSDKFSKNDNAKQYKFHNTITGILSTPPVSDLIDLSTKPSETEINQAKANAIIKYAKSNILTLSDDFINRFEKFATSHYFNTYGEDISFDALFIPESKSEHVNQFAKLIHNRYGLSAITKIDTIKK